MSDTTVNIRLHDPDAEPDLLDELTRAVRAELAECAVGEASLAPRPAPAGARAVDGSAAGELVVVLGASAAALRTVIRVLRAWRDRRPARTVDVRMGGLRLKLDDATAEQQDQVVEAFVDALRRGA